VKNEMKKKKRKSWRRRSESEASRNKMKERLVKSGEADNEKNENDGKKYLQQSTKKKNLS